MLLEKKTFKFTIEQRVRLLHEDEGVWGKDTLTGAVRIYVN